MKYYYHPGSPNCRKVSAVIEMLGIDADYKFVDLFKGKQAVGVEYEDAKGRVHQVRAKREVVLSAGAYNTPPLLEVSGVGRRDVLESLGVEVLHQNVDYGLVHGVSMSAGLLDELTGRGLGLDERGAPRLDEVSDIFARGGGETVARELDVPFLGEVPIDVATLAHLRTHPLFEDDRAPFEPEHCLEAEIPFYAFRYSVRPGLTGWAQVNGLRGNTSIEKRIEYDIFYIENWSVLFDLQILMVTPFKLLNTENALR